VGGKQVRSASCWRNSSRRTRGVKTTCGWRIDLCLSHLFPFTLSPVVCNVPLGIRHSGLFLENSLDLRCSLTGL
jgi:hypothetical protein